MRMRTAPLFIILFVFRQIFTGAPCCSGSISSHRAFRASIEYKCTNAASNTPTPKIQNSIRPLSKLNF
jgi:hypothetical protein